jgi:hypothetical protein
MWGDNPSCGMKIALCNQQELWRKGTRPIKILPSWGVADRIPGHRYAKGYCSIPQSPFLPLTRLKWRTVKRVLFCSAILIQERQQYPAKR